MLEAEVLAIAGGVLGNQNQLPDAACFKTSGLSNEIVDRAGPKSPTHGGDMAEGARVVAPFGHLEIGIAPGGEEPRILVIVDLECAPLVRDVSRQLTAHRFNDLFQFIEAYESIDFRDLPLQLFGICLRHTARHHQSPDIPVLFGLSHFED